MKPLLAALAVVAAATLSTSRVTAQDVVDPGPLGPASVVGWGYDPGPGPAVVVDPAFFPTTYSYWASYPFPARGYVGYGASDFPFYGTAYGSPSDPWTWPALSRYPGQGAAHYGALPPW